jgi:hypothetical protein
MKWRNNAFEGRTLPSIRLNDTARIYTLLQLQKSGVRVSDDKK